MEEAKRSGAVRYRASISVDSQACHLPSTLIDMFISLEAPWVSFFRVFIEISLGGYEWLNLWSHVGIQSSVPLFSVELGRVGMGSTISSNSLISIMVSPSLEKWSRGPPWSLCLCKLRYGGKGLLMNKNGNSYQENSKCLKLCARNQGQRLDIFFIISHHLRHTRQTELSWLLPASC